MYTTLSIRRVRWAGYVHHMGADLLHRQILHGELTEAPRPQGRPKLCFFQGMPQFLGLENLLVCGTPALALRNFFFLSFWL